MPTLVTGATGLVGNNVVRKLLERGDSVRVLTRESSDSRPLEGLRVDSVLGDVRDRESVRRACRGVDLVIHGAAYVQYGWNNRDLHETINTGGAANVADAAMAEGARMVHVSSADAVGVGSHDVPADENSSTEGTIPCPYVLTKQHAEQEVLRRVDWGLDAVIVNPTFMLGPWDWKPSSGQMLLGVAQGFSPVAPIGKKNFCDVRDVADGVLAAAERGRAGRRYILGGEDLEYLGAWRMFAEVTGARGPWMRMGPLIRFCVGSVGDLWGRVTGNEPAINSAAIAASSQAQCYSSARAIAELDYRPRPVREAVEAAWQWFREHGYAGSTRRMRSMRVDAVHPTSRSSQKAHSPRAVESQ